MQSGIRLVLINIQCVCDMRKCEKKLAYISVDCNIQQHSYNNNNNDRQISCGIRGKQSQFIDCLFVCVAQNRLSMSTVFDARFQEMHKLRIQLNSRQNKCLLNKCHKLIIAELIFARIVQCIDQHATYRTMQCVSLSFEPILGGLPFFRPILSGPSF